ncbi:MAG TPA: phenylalanine--tRNA ligase subunit beta, partial [Cellvibrionaceae bacterium]
HPDADKLRVCQVVGGPDGPVQVVCGAPNARVGIKVPFALVGATLPGDFNIKKAKLRGVESFGMLCAETELQAGTNDDGLWELAADASVGQDLRHYLNLNDSLIEVDITPNRGDCLSVRGLAREVGVINRATVTEVVATPVAATTDDILPVTLAAPEACSRYVGRIIRNIDISQPSPLWLQEKLRRAGLRTIDAVVDITNYVLLELGQPMHAFDLATLNGGITVREALAGEKLQLLDDQEITLTEGTLVIADDKAPLAMAGIMGGKASAVTSRTRDILLESAFFNPLAIAGRARSYGLHTDSSHRFERGVDYQLQSQAIERATELLLSIVGGEPGPVMEQVSEHLPEAGTVHLRRASISSGLYIELEDAVVEDILTRLGLAVTERTEAGWQLQVPSWRFDIAIEADLLEELARIYGYNRLPTRVPDSPMAIGAKPEGRLGLSHLRKHLIARDYQEVITYSFVDPADNARFDPAVKPIALQNPISADMAVRRSSLLPGLARVLSYNVNRQQQRVRLFETGLRFVPGSQGVQQIPTLTGLIYGPCTAQNWASDDEGVDFFDLKGDLQSLLGLTGKADSFSFAAAEHPAMHPGQCARVECQGEAIGYLGALHPLVQRELDVSGSVFVFELNMQPLTEARVPAFKPLSRFPAIRRDLALLVNRDLPVQKLLDGVQNTAGQWLTDLKVFDLYMGKGIDPHRKSLALGLTFQHPSRTLNDDEITASVAAVVETLKNEFDAAQR